MTFRLKLFTLFIYKRVNCIRENLCFSRDWFKLILGLLRIWCCNLHFLFYILFCFQNILPMLLFCNLLLQTNSLLLADVLSVVFIIVVVAKATHKAKLRFNRRILYHLMHDQILGYWLRFSFIFGWRCPWFFDDRAFTPFMFFHLFGENSGVPYLSKYFLVQLIIKILVFTQKFRGSFVVVTSFAYYLVNFIFEMLVFLDNFILTDIRLNLNDLLLMGRFRSWWQFRILILQR